MGVELFRLEGVHLGEGGEVEGEEAVAEALDEALAPRVGKGVAAPDDVPSPVVDVHRHPGLFVQCPKGGSENPADPRLLPRIGTGAAHEDRGEASRPGAPAQHEMAQVTPVGLFVVTIEGGLRQKVPEGSVKGLQGLVEDGAPVHGDHLVGAAAVEAGTEGSPPPDDGKGGLVPVVQGKGAFAAFRNVLLGGKVADAAHRLEGKVPLEFELERLRGVLQLASSAARKPGAAGRHPGGVRLVKAGHVSDGVLFFHLRNPDVDALPGKRPGKKQHEAAVETGDALAAAVHVLNAQCREH